MTIKTKSFEETIKEGEKFAPSLKKGDIIGLDGNLGSGKTQFVKGICNFYKVKEQVHSPTFIIVNNYKGLDADGKEFDIFHFDLYRLNLVSELTTIGFEEYLNTESIVLIEWSELAEKYLGQKIKKVLFSHGETENERIIEIN